MLRGRSRKFWKSRIRKFWKGRSWSRILPPTRNPDYGSCFFCLSPPFSSLIFYFLFSLHTHIYEPDMFRQIFFPGVFWPPVSPPHGFVIVYSFQGSNEQIKEYNSTAYLLYRCKHLCMLKFRVVSPSLTKKVYILHITDYINKSDNMIFISVM